MSQLTKYADMFREAETREGYWLKLSLLAFLESLRRVMGSTTQRELARKLGSTEAYVSQMLHDTDNFTLKQMNKVAHALDAAVHIHVAKRHLRVTWHEEPLVQGGPAPSTSESGTTTLSLLNTGTVMTREGEVRTGAFGG